MAELGCKRLLHVGFKGQQTHLQAEADTHTGVVSADNSRQKLIFIEITLNSCAHLLVRSPLRGVVGVEHLQPTHLTQVAMEIRTAVLIVTVSGGSVRTQLGEILIGPTHQGRGYRAQS